MGVNTAGRLPWNQSRPTSRSNSHQRWGHAQRDNVPFAEREQTEIGGSAAPPYRPPPKVLADVLSPAIDIPHISKRSFDIYCAHQQKTHPDARELDHRESRAHSAPCEPLFRARPMVGLKLTLKSDAASCERAAGASKVVYISARTASVDYILSYFPFTLSK